MDVDTLNENVFADRCKLTMTVCADNGNGKPGRSAVLGVTAQQFRRLSRHPAMRTADGTWTLKQLQEMQSKLDYCEPLGFKIPDYLFGWE
jgi:hypothetical protein